MKRVPNKRWPYLLLAPAILIVCFVVFYPAIKAVLISFQSYDYHKPSQMGYIGLENYVSIMKDKLFWQSLWRTIVWDVACVGLQFVFGFALALLLNSTSRVAESQGLSRWCRGSCRVCWWASCGAGSLMETMVCSTTS